MTSGLALFLERAPQLLAAAQAGDPQLSVRVREAMRECGRYDLPIGLKLGDAWIGAMLEKLLGVNMWMNDWRRRQQLRNRWSKHFWQVICKAEKVAAFEHLHHLGRAPACQIKMGVQVVRLVPSVNEFLKDDDSLSGAPKQLYDALKDVKLIREDRREWLAMQPPQQDVSPIFTLEPDAKGRPKRVGTPVTLFFLWPVATPTSKGSADVHRPVRRSPSEESQPEDRGAEERRAVPRVRRRAGPRAVDV